MAKAVGIPDPVIGTIFGRLTVASCFYAEQRQRYATCRCSCGTELVVRKDHLTTGDTKSCGCLQVELLKERCSTHGLIRTAIYGVWRGMKHRCQSPTYRWYADYGGRGIKVCDAWQSFENFYSDMGEPPFKGATLERLDNDGMYCKENCVWADKKTQAYNRRNSVLWEYKGKRYRLADLVELSGLKQSTLLTRLNRGWSVEQAVETQPHAKPNSALENSVAATKYKLYGN